jgi:hypothetical protein
MAGRADRHEWPSTSLHRRRDPRCVTLKVLFGLPLRDATRMVASLLDLAGLEWPVPDFSTLCRRQKTLTVHIPFRPSTAALHLLIDRTGVKAESDDKWLAEKHGPSKPLDWRKVRLWIDAETLEIRAIEITASQVGDAPMLLELLAQTPDDQPLGIVTAGGACDTRASHAAIAARGATAVTRRADNPHFTEGGVTRTVCDTDAEFAAAPREIDRWTREQGHGPARIDPGFDPALKAAFEAVRLEMLH